MVSRDEPRKWRPENLVQVGIGGWQVPREAVEIARERKTNILTLSDVEKLGISKTIEMALELAWKDTDMVYMSFDIDSIDCGFVPGTGWPSRRILPRKPCSWSLVWLRRGSVVWN